MDMILSLFNTIPYKIYFKILVNIAYPRFGCVKISSNIITNIRSTKQILFHINKYLLHTLESYVQIRFEISN